MKVEMFEDVENKYDLEPYTLYVDSSGENSILLMMGGETVEELINNFAETANEYAFAVFNPYYKEGMNKFDAKDLEPLFEKCGDVGKGRMGKNTEKYTKNVFYSVCKEENGWSVIFHFNKEYFFSKMNKQNKGYMLWKLP